MEYPNPAQFICRLDSLTLGEVGRPRAMHNCHRYESLPIEKRGFVLFSKVVFKPP